MKLLITQFPSFCTLSLVGKEAH